ncbi:membrane protein [[Mycobacterium] chelonae subsp. bovistauri]|nr:membrane protein [Mycobacterium sp. QIA-37]
MMGLVWVIDVLVIIVQIMGGRRQVNPVLRIGLWVSFVCLLVAGIAALGGLLVLLQMWLTTLR